MKDITDNRRLLVQTTFTTHTFLRNLMTDSITIYNIVTENFFFYLLHFNDCSPFLTRVVM